MRKKHKVEDILKDIIDMLDEATTELNICSNTFEKDLLKKDIDVISFEVERLQNLTLK